MKIGVVVVASPAARQVVELPLMVEQGASVSQVLQISGLVARFPELAEAALGIWGKKVTAQHVVHDQDRIELYRPLKVEPKLARRARFVKQGSRSAGLFARTRPGGKAGY